MESDGTLPHNDSTTRGIFRVASFCLRPVSSSLLPLFAAGELRVVLNDSFQGEFLLLAVRQLTVTAMQSSHPTFGTNDEKGT